MKKVLILFLILFGAIFIPRVNVNAITQKNDVVAYSDYFTLTGNSTNGKRLLVGLYLNESGNIVVVWQVDRKGYQAESTLTINNEQYLTEEIVEGTQELTIYDTNNKVLKSLNDSSKYYFAQPLHESQKLTSGFVVTIKTNAGGHDLQGVSFYIEMVNPSIYVQHNYKSSSTSDELDFDLSQSVNNCTIGKNYSLSARENNGYSFSHATVKYENGTTETFYTKDINVVGSEGRTEVIFYYGIGYRVEYYYDNAIDESLTKFYFASYGDVISSYQEHLKEGFRFDYVNPESITLSETLEDPVIKVYYTSAPLILPKVTLLFTHLTGGNSLDPTVPYEYKITYYSNGELVTENFTLSDKESESFAIDENSEYEITLLTDVNDGNVYYNGDSNFDKINKKITGVSTSDDITESIQLYNDMAVLTGINTGIAKYIVLILITISSLLITLLANKKTND